jgi:UDP-N-acetylmuramoylalanine--D-glutamate ligase
LLDQKYDARLIGNIGNPALSEKKITKKTVFVIEASSYQLDYSKIFTSKYALILNISPDHLERHKNLKNYVKAKFKLLNSQSNKSIALVKKNDPLISKAIYKGNFKQKIIKVNTLKNDKIFDQLKNQYFLSFGNKENLSFVLKISKLLKLDNKNLLKTLNKFKGLKYRQQIIYKKKNLTIINDSKSTSFASSENLLKSLNNVYWILGGIPNFKAFIFGNNYKEFRRHLKNKMFVTNFINLKNVLSRILLDIKKQKLQKNIIFFSPAGASFDSFKNFEDRGQYFNQLVKKLLNAKR